MALSIPGTPHLKVHVPQLPQVRSYDLVRVTEDNLQGHKQQEQRQPQWDQGVLFDAGGEALERPSTYIW